MSLEDVVRCKDCKYWRDEYVTLNDGRERPHIPEDIDHLGLPYVSISVGINHGAMCHIEDHTGWIVDKSVFRNAEDYCSRGELRPVSYDEWWGIKDGFYPRAEDDR